MRNENAEYFDLHVAVPNRLVLLIYKKPVFQPIANRQIIEFQTSVCYTDRQDKRRYGDKYVRSHECIGIVCHPRHLHIGKGIMGNIERIGDFAQIIAYGHTVFPLYLAAGSHRHDNGEQKGIHAAS